MGRSWRGIVVLSIGMLAAGALALSPALSAQKPLTKKKANKLYVNVGEQASDSDLLDGMNSSQFLGATATATDSELLDGMDSAAFQGAYASTILVSPVGTPTENGAALQAALAGISGNSATNPFLLKLEPGIYDLGAGTLTTKPFVDIEGSGEEVTTIRGTGSSNANQGTIILDGSAEIRFLTVENEFDGMAYSKAIYSSGGGSLYRITAEASGGGAESIGIDVLDGTTVFDSLVTVTSSPIGTASGISASSSNVAVFRSGIIASGLGTPDVALDLNGTSGLVEHSSLIGENDAATVDASSTLLIGGSRIQGGVTSSGTATCAGNWDGAFTFVPSTCPA